MCQYLAQLWEQFLKEIAPVNFKSFKIPKIVPGNESSQSLTYFRYIQEYKMQEQPEYRNAGGADWSIHIFFWCHKVCA